MAKVIYPVIGKQTALPIYLAGIGISEYEYHINRENGLISHQILYTSNGSGILHIGGETYRLSERKPFLYGCRKYHTNIIPKTVIGLPAGLYSEENISKN